MDDQRRDIDARYRSLLQKAARRGSEDLVFTVSALLGARGSEAREWYRRQAAAIVFQDCWPLGGELVFNTKFHSKVAALVKLARRRKQRDALGLGHLAHALHAGNRSVLDGGPGDRDIRVVAAALERPEEYWDWVARQRPAGRRRALADAARRFRRGGYLHDRAVIAAAAYLAATGPVPGAESAPPDTAAFPYWIVFDRHTPQGKRALRSIARDLHMAPAQLAWCCFYFEAAAPNAESPSAWWRRYCRWRFAAVGLPPAEAHLLWEPAKPQLVQALAGESRQLKHELYRWKMAHLQEVEQLKRQVTLFIEGFEGIGSDQMALF